MNVKLAHMSGIFTAGVRTVYEAIVTCTYRPASA